MAQPNTPEWEALWDDAPVGFTRSSLLFQAKREYMRAHGLGKPSEGLQDVRQSRMLSWGIANAYAAGKSTPNGWAVRLVYGAFIRETYEQAAWLRHYAISIVHGDGNPFEDAPAAAEWFRRHSGDHIIRYPIFPSEQGAHPILSAVENDVFRGVHDLFGHLASGRGFDRHGEEAAYRSHVEMYSPTAREAMATETRGQNSALIWTGEFPPEKAMILPAWAREV